MTNKLAIKPEHDYIFIEHVKAKQTVTSSGIVLTELTKFKDTLVGKVVAVSDTSTYPLTVAVGDEVYFIESEVKSKTILDGKEYLVINESKLLGYKR